MATQLAEQKSKVKSKGPKYAPGLINYQGSSSLHNREVPYSSYTGYDETGQKTLGTATVTLLMNGVETNPAGAVAKGPIDAALQALVKLVPFVYLTEEPFKLAPEGPGGDAVAEVFVTLGTEFNGRVITRRGRARSYDSVRAGYLAFIHALNRLDRALTQAEDSACSS